MALHALLGVARLGSSRLNAHSNRLCVTIGGIRRATGRTDLNGLIVMESGLTITRILNDNPNTARCVTKGFVPVIGQEVIITLGSHNNYKREFAGNIRRLTQGYVGSPANYQHQLDMVDYTWGLGKLRVFEAYTSTTVLEVATDLIAKYASGYTLDIDSDVCASSVDAISFTDQDLPTALTSLFRSVGASWRCDYFKAIKAFFDDTSDTAPTSLTSAHTSLENLSINYDMSQVITRVFSEGGGANVLSDVAVGETIIPVETVAWYPELGGVVRSGPQRCSYTSVDAGGAGTLVGPGAAPSSAPSASSASGSGVNSGSHDYAVTYTTASGESLPGPRVSITVGTVSAPASAPNVGSPTAGTGPDAGGAHKYAVTFVTASGETTPSALSSSVSTTAAVSDPSTAPASFGFFNDWVNSPEFGTGAYRWAYTFKRVSDGAETALSPVSDSHVPYGPGQYYAEIRTFDSAPSGYVRQWYRTKSDGSTYFRVPSAMFLFHNGGFGDVYSGNEYTDSGGSGTAFFDGCSDSALGAAAPGSNSTAIRTVPLTGIPTGSAAVTSRKVYRTAAGGSQLKLVGTIADNVTTTYSDTVTDASLGANVPTSNTATANQVSLTSIPVGASSVTGRKIYRTAAGGSTLKLLHTISDNTTATYTDTTADASLGADAPGSDTSGLTQPDGVVLAGATSLIVAGVAFARSSGGWAIIGNGKQCIRYTGISGNTLTGIPSTGAGSIQATVSYNSTITAAPMLLGVPASGTGSVRTAFTKGDAVNIVAQVDDTDAQTALAGYIGGDGVQEASISDNRLTYAEAYARGLATLALRKDVAATLSYTSRDINTREGLTISVNLDPPTSITADFLIQQVDEHDWKMAADGETAVPPTYTVQAQSERFTFDDLLRTFRAAGA